MGLILVGRGRSCRCFTTFNFALTFSREKHNVNHRRRMCVEKRSNGPPPALSWQARRCYALLNFVNDLLVVWRVLVASAGSLSFLVGRPLRTITILLCRLGAGAFRLVGGKEPQAIAGRDLSWRRDLSWSFADHSRDCRHTSPKSPTSTNFWRSFAPPLNSRCTDLPTYPGVSWHLVNLLVPHPTRSRT